MSLRALRKLESAPLGMTYDSVELSMGGTLGPGRPNPHALPLLARQVARHAAHEHGVRPRVRLEMPSVKPPTAQPAAESKLLKLPAELFQSIAELPGVAPALANASKALRIVCGESATQHLISLRCEALIGPEGTFDPLLDDPLVPADVIRDAAPVPRAAVQRLAQRNTLAIAELVHLIGRPPDGSGQDASGALGLKDPKLRSLALASIERLMEAIGVEGLDGEPLAFTGEGAVSMHEVFESLGRYAMTAEARQLLANPPR